MKIVQFGYDYMNLVDQTQCQVMLVGMLKGVECGDFPLNVTCYHELHNRIQYDYVDNVSSHYSQHTSINLLGSLQQAGGVVGARVGSPVLDKASPPQLTDASCLHPTAEGFEVIAAQMWETYFKAEELKRLGNNSTRSTNHPKDNNRSTIGKSTRSPTSILATQFPT